MRNETRLKYNALTAAMARTYGVSNVSDGFNALPPMAVRLNDAIQDSIDFLGMISQIPVTDIVGEAVRVQIQKTLAGRTDMSVKGARREPSKAKAPDGPKYTCAQTNFDVGIDYDTMDTWARFADFSQRYMNAVFRRIGLDRMLIGFYGSSVAKQTDPVANPTLSDVNIGWLQLLKTYMPSHYLTQGKTNAQIQIGDTGDYKNLDQFVYDVYQMIPIKDRSGSEVVFIGQGLVAHDMGKALSAWAQKPIEKMEIQVLDKSYGGLRCMIVPNYPVNGFMITDPQNLQIYYQDSSVRRRTKDEPEFNRVADYISMNEAYMISDLEGVASVEAANVKFV